MGRVQPFRRRWSGRLLGGLALLAPTLAALAVLYAFQQPAAVSEAAAAPVPVSAGYPARVVEIADGDTLTVQARSGERVRVRLAEIDAPESDQPFGDRSRSALRRLVQNREVMVRAVDTDAYGRTVAHVSAGGQNVNRALVEEGAAWCYRRYLTDATLLTAEADARRGGKGLWSSAADDRVAPWDWRQGVRAASDDAEPPRFSTPVAFAQTSSGFTCSGKRTCRQMGSCAEAKFYLRQCGVNSLDGDGDGVPCDVICRPR